MSDLGAIQGVEVEAAPQQQIEQAPQQQVATPSMQDLYSAQESKNVRTDFDKAVSTEDWDTANKTYGQMRNMAGQASTQVIADGGDPLKETRPIGMFVHPDVEVERRGMLAVKRHQEEDEWISGPENEWFMNVLIPRLQQNGEKYKEINKEMPEWKPATMTPAEKEYYISRLKPAVEDPNEVADWNQGLVKMDIAGKQKFGPEFSVYTHPSTRNWANYVSREAGAGVLGYVQSGEQEMELGMLGRGAYMVAEAADRAGDSIARSLRQSAEMFDMTMDGMGFGDGQPLSPMNWIETADGQIIPNYEKPHFGMMELIQAANSAMAGESITAGIGRMNRVAELERAQRHGLMEIVHGIANTGGELAGFAIPAGAVGKLGSAAAQKLTQKGLTWLGSLGMKGVQSERAVKMITTMARGAGQATGAGAFQSFAYGKEAGYVNQFMHGVAMDRVMRVVGHYEGRLEGFLAKRKNIPAKAASVVAGGVMLGVPFAAMEEMDKAQWDYMKDPDDATWKTFVKHVFGAMFFKTGMLAIGGGMSPELQQIAKTKQQLKQRQKRSSGSEIDQQIQSSTSLKERSKLSEQKAELDKQLDIKEYGPENTVETELKQISAEETAGAPEKIGKQFQKERSSLHERITEQRRQKRESVHEDRQRVAKEAVKLDKSKKEMDVKHETEASDLRKKMDEQIKLTKEHREKHPEEGPWSLSPKENVEGSIYGPKVREMEQRHRQEQAEVAQQKKDLYPGVEVATKEGVTEEKSGEIDVGKRISESQDPIDHPDFTSRPEAERKALMAAKTKLERQTLDWRIKEAGGVSEKVLEGVKAEHVKLKERLDAEALEPKRTEAKDKARSPEEELRLGNERRVKSKLPEGQAERRTGERRVEGEAPGDGGDEARMAAGRSTRIPSKAEREAGAEFGPGSRQTVPGRQIEAIEGAKKVNLDDIRAEMQGRLPRKGVRIPFTPVRIGAKKGDPVRPAFAKGRIGGGQGVEGLYKIFENLIRTQGGKDLVTDAHEWSHAMQIRMQGGKGGKQFTDNARQWADELPKAVKAEFPAILEGYSNWQRLKPARQGMEVWAEWHARELLGDSRLESEAPKLTQYFREQMADPMNAAIREQYARIKDSILNYTQIGAEERVRQSWASITEKPSAAIKATKPTRIQRARDSFLKATAEENIDLRRATEEWIEASGRDPAEVSITEDPSRMRDIYAGTAHKQAEHLIMKGFLKPDGTRIPGAKDVFDGLKGRMPEFTDYLVAVVNVQRIMRGNEATLSKTDYVTTLRNLQQRHPDFRKKARDLKEWSDMVVDRVAESGNLSAESAQRIKDAYVAWVPFVRRMSTPSARGGASGAVAPVREAVGRVKGGGSERIEDPIMALFDTTASMLSNAHRSEIMSALYRMAVGHEAGGIATVVPKTKVPKEHPLRVILEAMERQVEIPGDKNDAFGDILSTLKSADALDAQTLTLFSPKTIPVGEKNIITFTPRLTAEEIKQTSGGDPHLAHTLEQNQGKPLWLEINDPRIYNSLMSLDTVPVAKFYQNNLVGKLMKGSADVTRFFATSIQPAYSATALLRDIQTQPMFSTEGKFRPGGGMWRAIEGAVMMAKDGRINEMFDASGIGMSSFLNEGTRRKMVGEARTGRQKIMSYVDKAQDFLAKPESWLRRAEFKTIYNKAIKEGKSEREAQLLAAEAGREIAINFARGGVVAGAVNPSIPYTKATIAGWRKMFVALTGSMGKTDVERAHLQRMAFINGITNITIPSLMLWWMNKDEEWYQDMPGWQKASYQQASLGDGDILQFPRTYEMGVIFGAIPEMAMNQWVEENGNPPNMYDALGEAMFPYMKGPQQLIPSLFKPLAEQATGVDFFRNRPMTPYFLERSKLPEDQSMHYTTEGSKILSKAINGAMTPIQLDHMLDGYTAGVGTYVSRMAEHLTGLREYASDTRNPFRRLFKEEHQYGVNEDTVYDIDRQLSQKSGSKVITPAEKNLQKQIRKARGRFSDINDRVRDGSLDSKKANRMKYEIARPLVERYEEMTK